MDPTVAMANRIVDAYIDHPADPRAWHQLEQVLLGGPEPLKTATRARLDEIISGMRSTIEAAGSPPLTVGVVWSTSPIGVDGGPPVVWVRIDGRDVLCPVLIDEPLKRGDQVGMNSAGAVVERLPEYHGDQIARVEAVKLDTDEAVLDGPAHEPIVVALCPSLRDDPALKAGCRVRYGPALRLATDMEEPVDEESAAIADQLPDLGFDDIGGLSDVKERLVDMIEVMLATPAELAEQNLRKRVMALFTGPAGTGKTYSAMVLASELRRRTGTDRIAFDLVGAADLLDPLVGRTEANIRARFSRVRARADRGIGTVMVWDEFDALFRARSQHVGSTIVDSTLVPQLLKELDGMAALDNVLVVAITNRPELLDSAVVRPLRLGYTIDFRGPTWPEAVEIFDVHLVHHTPAAGVSLVELADRGAAAIFAPRARGGADVATVRFYDGHREAVKRSDLVTGALIASACESAGEAAWHRGRRGGIRGMTPLDLVRAVDNQYAGYARRLSPGNLAEYLGWPHDKASAVTAVERVERTRERVSSVPALVPALAA